MACTLVSLFIIFITLIPFVSTTVCFSNRATIGGVITYPDVIFVDGNDTRTIGGVIGPGRIFFNATNLTLLAGGEITIEESVRVQCNNHTNTVSLEWVSDTFDSSCKNITIWFNDIKAIAIGDDGEGSTISNSQLMPKDSMWIVRIMTEMDAGWESGNYSIVMRLRPLLEI